MMDYKDWGFNREAGGSTWRRRTVGHRGDGSVRRANPADPDGLHAGGWHRGVLDAQLYLKLLRGAWL